MKNRKKELMGHEIGAENVNEQRLFHGTDGNAIESICKNNFDLRNSGRAVGTRFGHGKAIVNK